MIKIKLFLPQEEIEPEAMKMIENMATMPFIHPFIAIMPDVHLGKGACVGSAIPCIGAVIPAAVGVDIGCGVMAVKTQLYKKDLPEDLKKLRESIERSIPLSAGQYNTKITESAQTRIDILAGIKDQKENWREQLGSLGSGNHFIEICLDENEQVWCMLHSGSRGVGNKIAQYHIQVAKDLMKKFYIDLPDEDLAYLPEGTQEFNNYMNDLEWAQMFAIFNREEMMDRVIKDLSYFVFNENNRIERLETINCHHNYTAREKHMGKDVIISRKGAISAHKGVLGIIPGSMGAKSYVVEGKGNYLGLMTSPHGAGRKFSRKKARETYNIETLQKETEGVECRIREALIDETPSAYKDIDRVVEQSKDLIDVKFTLKQIVNIKGD